MPGDDHATDTDSTAAPDVVAGESAPQVRASARTRRRRRRRRRVIVGVAAVVVVAAGAGTAYGLSGSSGPDYRVAAVTRGTVEQTVDADGSLAATRVSTASFASSGTVSAVRVAVGDTVRAGQVLATLDPSDLDAAVTSAQAAVAQARQKLTDDEDGTSTTTGTGTGTSAGTGSGTSAGTTSAGTGTTTTSAITSNGSTAAPATASATLLASRTSTPTPTNSSTPTKPTSTEPTTPTSSGGASSGTAALRAAVEKAATALVAAVQTQIHTIASACATKAESAGTQVSAAPDASGTITATVGSQPAIVTLLQGGTLLRSADNGAPIAAGGSYAFTGLTAGQTYTVEVVRTSVIDSADCTSAITDAGDKDGPVAQASSTFQADLAALQKALAAAGTGTGSTGTGSTGSRSNGTSGTSSGTSGSRTTGSGSTSSRSSASGSSASGSSASGSSASGSSASGSSAASSGSSAGSTVTITAEQIAADTAAVTKAKADVTLAKYQAAGANLTSPIAGTVAAVTLASGDSVSAGSSSSTVTVVARGALSVQVDIPLTKIDLVKVGQHATVTVDGRATPLPATVTYVGITDASSAGSTASYPVTVQLNGASSSLYDGMGAQVSIAVGTARNALVVPLSALHTIGTRQFVSLVSGSTLTPTVVTVGLVGADAVEVTKGVSAGQHVEIADASSAVPSTTSTTTRRAGTNSLTGLTGGGFTGGGFTGGGFTGAGRFGGGN